ncbi:unnamed protein product [Callosobruchus maculatus]|uniref:Uncharacterized protein n=1 Tax=Callosobruchus maculatus TaxID=64391 RepID=A0A653DWY7_CALMS|nr:unnamed protein product [Callosobruchus maculatus]
MHFRFFMGLHFLQYMNKIIRDFFAQVSTPPIKHTQNKTVY